jgi:hypothetical protein
MFDGEKKEYKKIVKRYNDYISLYAMCNQGSTAGATPFEEFYWRFSYIIKYDDPAALWQSGY